MPRNVIFQGDIKALLAKYELLAKQDKRKAFIANGECARLPQELTNVGHTSRWQPGPRVVDLTYLLPGTVIANFKFESSQARYPNEHGYHAGLFHQFEHGAMMANGLPCVFSMIDQWTGKHPKPVGVRGVAILSAAFKHAHPEFDTASNRADDFYVVVVP